MSTGGNGVDDLRMLLKARVVKLKVELDVKGSNLPTQVNGITKLLKDKPVKLNIELKATQTDLNSQISKISRTMQSSKSFKPIKIAVEIDVKGAAQKIKQQLNEVNQAVSDFNKKYGGQVKQVQETQKKMATAMTETSKSMNIPTNATTQNFNNIKDYVKQLSEAERILRSKLSATQGKGALFSSVEIKDAQGNLKGFVATLQTANGVMEKLRYSWNKDKNQFQIIDRQTVTQTEAALKKSTQSLENLQRELGKTGAASKELSREYQALQQAAKQGTLTMDMVRDLQMKIQKEKEDVRVQKEKNTLLLEQKKLVREISNTTKGTQGKFASETQTLVSKAQGAESMAALKGVRLEMNLLSDKVKEYNTNQKEAQRVDKQRETALRQLTKYLRETHETEGALAQTNIRAVREMTKRATTTEQMVVVQKKLNDMYHQQQSIKYNTQVEDALQRLKTKMLEYGQTAGYSAETLEKKFAQAQQKTAGNMAAIEKEIRYYNGKIIQSHNEVKKAELDLANNSVIKNANKTKLKGLIEPGNTEKLKGYLSELQKIDIATMRVTDNSSKSGKVITATLTSTGKTAKQVTYEVDKLSGQLKYMGQQEVFNPNRNLGFFEQMKVALARVPVWMSAMTIFYGSIRNVKKMATEILNVDKALTELKRVASDQINMDSIFAGAVKLSKDLGNNIHDVLATLGDFARTYGEFNERQLLAITNTATLMSNVSELNAQEAGETLVGTMNAFGILADESIKIADSFNEVKRCLPVQ